MQSFLKSKVLLLVLTLSLLLLGCGPKVKQAPDQALSGLKILAVLPIDRQLKGGVTQDRLDFLQTTLSSKLSSQGLTVVDQILVSQACESASCTDRHKLTKEFGVNGFVVLSIDSIRRANFLAGYINSITGTLDVQDSNGTKLISITQTEQERGGLLFNSGQLVQGVVSQVENSGETSFTRLADRFIQTLVTALPLKTLSGVSSQINNAAISDIKVRKVQPEVYEVCVNGTPNSAAHLVIKPKKTNLREVQPGKYCGVLRLERKNLSSGELVAELRSPFGTSARSMVSLDTGDACLPEDSIRLVKKGLLNRVEVDCLALGNQALRSAQCSDKKLCTIGKLLVYRSNSPEGPFRRVAEIANNNGWTDLSTTKNQQAYYEVVSVGKNGAFSSPLHFESVN